MFPAAKIVGLSAILSVAIVTAYELPQARETAPVEKKHTDRLLPTQGEPTVQIALYSVPASTEAAASTGEVRKGDSLRVNAGDRCASQTWPNISSDCLVAANGTPARKAVRTITIEERTGPNTSTLIRRPAAEMAGR